MSEIADPKPKPEGNWTFRRLWVYGGGLIGLSLLTAIVVKLASPRELMWVAIALIARDGLRELVYLIAPSAQAIVAGIGAYRGRG